IFPGGMPPELMHLATQLQDDTVSEPAKEEPPRPQLTVVTNQELIDSETAAADAESEKSADDGPTDDGDDSPTPPGRSHLRVVK
ncbi:MAG: hypothetical protein AAFX94_24960, partial [Myxococcota bacterium]